LGERRSVSADAARTPRHRPSIDLVGVGRPVGKCGTLCRQGLERQWLAYPAPAATAGPRRPAGDDAVPEQSELANNSVAIASRRGEWVCKPNSVLEAPWTSATVISLRRLLPDASSTLPGSHRRATDWVCLRSPALPYVGLLPTGFSQPARYRCRWWALTPPFHPYRATSQGSRKATWEAVGAELTAPGGMFLFHFP